MLKVGVPSTEQRDVKVGYSLQVTIPVPDRGASSVRHGAGAKILVPGQ